ncbi:MAG TPA: hypothetical protein VNI55_14325 [Gaiellaceae bacterium]|nr:hypothetical protein [Gaiellaceae bacterium]
MKRGALGSTLRVVVAGDEITFGEHRKCDAERFVTAVRPLLPKI